SDAEKAAAYAVACRVRDYLAALGWPEPIFADSGNGYHLLYRIPALTSPLPLAADDSLKLCLLALKAQFDTPEAEIDPKVFNPPRICKLYGMVARKGIPTVERPQRRAVILNAPDQLEDVPAAALASLAEAGRQFLPAQTPVLSAPTVQAAAPALMSG